MLEAKNIFLKKIKTSNFQTMERVTEIRKQFDKLVKIPEDISETAPGLFQELEKMEITLKILQKSKIGFSLNQVRKLSSDEEVQKTAKNLLKKWKTLEDGPAKENTKKVESKPKTESKAQVDFEISAELPTRNKKNELVFSDQPDFR